MGSISENTVHWFFIDSNSTSTTCTCRLRFILILVHFFGWRKFYLKNILVYCLLSFVRFDFFVFLCETKIQCWGKWLNYIPEIFDFIYKITELRCSSIFIKRFLMIFFLQKELRLLHTYICGSVWTFSFLTLKSLKCTLISGTLQKFMNHTFLYTRIYNDVGNSWPFFVKLTVSFFTSPLFVLQLKSWNSLEGNHCLNSCARCSLSVVLRYSRLFNSVSWKHIHMLVRLTEIVLV